MIHYYLYEKSTGNTVGTGFCQRNLVKDHETDELGVRYDEPNGDGTHAPPDYKTLRRGAYPAVEEQLDALWKGGVAAEEMKQRILSVKARYPKTAG